MRLVTLHVGLELGVEIGVERGRALGPRLLQVVELLERALRGVLLALLRPGREVVRRPDRRPVEAVAKVLEGVCGAEEVAGMADLGVRVEGEVLVAPLDRRELRAERAHDVEVDDQLLEPGDETALRAMMDYNKAWLNMARCHDGSFVALPGRDMYDKGYYMSSRLHLTGSMALVLSMENPKLRIQGGKGDGSGS